MIRLTEEHADWVISYQDETWWSRFEQPTLNAWAEADKALRLMEKVKQKDDPDPKALACYGLLVRGIADGPLPHEQTWLRFVDGRPVSAITVQLLEWCCAKLKSLGIRVLSMVWDNASWHISHAVRNRIREHNRQVKRTGEGVRILACLLPIKSLWLNPIEPKWMHGKRRVAEPNRTLSAQELADRVCAAFGCDHEVHLAVPENVS